MDRKERHNISTAGELSDQFQQRKHMKDKTLETGSLKNALFKPASWKNHVLQAVYTWGTYPQFTALTTENSKTPENST